MNLRRNRIYELKDVFLLFGKNAPSFWHPLGSSNDCVAASEAMRFSVRSLGCALFYLGGRKMRRVLASVLALVMVLSLCACGATTSNDDILKNAVAVDMDTIVSDTDSNIAKAKSLYCGKDLLITGYVVVISEDHIELDDSDTTLSSLVDVYLSSDDIANLESEQRITVAGHMSDEIETEQKTLNGWTFEFKHYSLNSAYLVNDRYEVSGVLGQKVEGSSAIPTEYNFKLGAENALAIISFADTVDVSSLPRDEEATYSAKIFRSDLPTLTDATPVK